MIIGVLFLSVKYVTFILKFNLTDTIMKQEVKGNAPAGAVYGLGFIGAAIYFISTATSFWMGVLGFLKAIVWPVFMIYEAFKFLGA